MPAGSHGRLGRRGTQRRLTLAEPPPGHPKPGSRAEIDAPAEYEGPRRNPETYLGAYTSAPRDSGQDTGSPGDRHITTAARFHLCARSASRPLGKPAVMVEYVMKQSPDGSWSATAPNHQRVDNIAGWDAVRAVVQESNRLRWQSTREARRFRAQFGTPPSDLDATIARVTATARRQ